MSPVSFQRVLPLEGGCNFRDLGGYLTSDGRSIRHGMLFRSGVMSYFTPADHPRLTALQLRTICDLRHTTERETEPTRWPTDIEMVTWDYQQLHFSQLQSKTSGEKSGDGYLVARNAMIEAYRTMTRTLRPQLKGILEYLATGKAPLLFHCAAGKDRTGLSAAIVLHTLGVPRETIFADYELTNQAVNLHAFMRKHHRAALGVTDQEHPLDAMADGVRDAMLKADPDYLSAAFDQIEKDHVSVDAYIRDMLGINDENRGRLRDALLTD